MKLINIIKSFYRNKSKEFESYKPFLKDISKKVEKGYVVSKEEKKRLNDIGWEAKRTMENARYILSLSSLNSLPSFSSRRHQLLYIIQFQSLDEKRQAQELALKHGAVQFIGDDNTFGLSNNKQRKAIDERGIEYEVHFDYTLKTPQ